MPDYEAFQLKPLSEWDQLKKEVREFEAHVKSLTNERQGFTDTVNATHQEVREADEKFQALMLRLREEHAAKKAEISKRASEALQKARELNKQIQDWQYKLNAANIKLASLAELEAMAARMSFAENKIKELFVDSLWWTKGAEFQREDITFITTAYMHGKSGILNANDMGLGKTMETAAANQILTALFNAEFGRQPKRLWLTKKSLVKSNCFEIMDWVPDERPITCTGNPDQRDFLTNLALSSGNVLVANYEAVSSTPLIRNTQWDFVYIDEVHKLKGGANPSGPTGVWKYVKDVCAKAKFTIMLSGSPILNHPREMWSYLHIFDAERFRTVKQFERDFCYGYGEVEVDWTKLITVLKDQCFKRTKKEVSKQLKALDIEKLPDVRHLEMSGEQQAIYDEIRTRFFIWLDAEHEHALTMSAVIAQLTRLRQVAMFPAGVKIETPDGQTLRINVEDSVKMDEAMDLIEELTEQGEQVLFFSSQFNEPMFEIQRCCAKLNKHGVSCELITGENSDKTQEIEKRFQQGEIQVLGINMKTGSEGLNLQKNPDKWPGGSSHVIFLDRWWNNGVNTQAEDRLVRFGQTDVVTVHVLHIDNSVDDFIKALCDQKDAMITGIMGANELRSPQEWKNYLKDIL